jgi:biotin carboxyl carrier protein
MKLDVRIGGRARTVTIERGGHGELRVFVSRPANDCDGPAAEETPAGVAARVAAGVSAGVAGTTPRAEVEADVIDLGGGAYSILLDGAAFDMQVVAEKGGVSVLCRGREFHASVRDPRVWRRGENGLQETHAPRQVIAPMPGKVVRVLVSAGETVAARQGLVVVEAMKMQNEIRAPKEGVIERVFVREGQAVTTGEALVNLA